MTVKEIKTKLYNLLSDTIIQKVDDLFFRDVNINNYKEILKLIPKEDRGYIEEINKRLMEEEVQRSREVILLNAFRNQLPKKRVSKLLAEAKLRREDKEKQK